MLETTDTQLVFLYPGVSSNKEHVLNRFPDTNFIFLTITSAVKELTSVYETQVTGEIDMSQEGEGPHSDDNKSFIESKENHNFSYISDFQRIRLGEHRNERSLKETWNVNLKLGFYIKI